MDIITLNEALVAQLVEADGVDATNVIQKLRNAQQIVLNSFFNRPVDLTDEKVQKYLHIPFSSQSVDDVIIMASQNGMRDLFAI